MFKNEASSFHPALKHMHVSCIRNDRLCTIHTAVLQHNYTMLVTLHFPCKATNDDDIRSTRDSSFFLAALTQ